MTWPELTDIKKNPRYTNRRYLCPYYTLRVSKSLDLWGVFGRLSNFEKCNLRSGPVTWRRDLWYHRVNVFLEMCQIVGWTAMANLVALCAAVFSLSAKNLRADNRPPPPAVRGLRQSLSIYIQPTTRELSLRKVPLISWCDRSCWI